ncbi:MAG: DUF192 domain-containing protein [Candidatus Peribacteria bacterium]|nr:MAG: DUF192 domain-containing protein [Candidatus Peribacteria bacterium]
MEIADTVETRTLGLMSRTELAADAGMRFVFETEAPRRKFWMKNTLIPLDMIWVDSSLHVVYIETQVPPCEITTCPTYGPDEQVSQYVLELNAGEVAKQQIKIGDSVKFILQ